MKDRILWLIGILEIQLLISVAMYSLCLLGLVPEVVYYHYSIIRNGLFLLQLLLLMGLTRKFLEQ
ncbi:MAG: hypothetical protein U0Y10_17585 [Spirosomataceae bacterium]